LPNDALGRVLLDALHAVGPPPFDDADRAFARTTRDTLPAVEIESGLRAAHASPDLLEAVLHERVDMPFDPGRLTYASTDVGDVSWAVPTSQLWVATMPIGTPGHSWQLTAAAG